MLTIINVAVFITACILTIVVYNIFFAKRFQVLERLKRVSKSRDQTILETQGKQEDFWIQFLSFMGLLGRLFSRKGPYMEKLRKKLLYARWYVKTDEFVGFKLFLALVGGFMLFILTRSFLVGFVGITIGFIIPDFVLNNRAKSRMNKLEMQLPEALSIISNGLRAGLGFYQALTVVTRDMVPPIKEEFDQVIFENSMGKPTDEVLINLRERTDSNDLDVLISALLIQKQVGGSLAEILDSISHTIRERVRIKGEIKTLTTQGKLSALIITLLPIGIGTIIYILNPEYMNQLFTNSIGMIMLLLAGVMMIIGAFFVRRIVDIEF